VVTRVSRSHIRPDLMAIPCLVSAFWSGTTCVLPRSGIFRQHCCRKHANKSMRLSTHGCSKTIASGLQVWDKPSHNDAHRHSRKDGTLLHSPPIRRRSGVSRSAKRARLQDVPDKLRLRGPAHGSNPYQVGNAVPVRCLPEDRGSSSASVSRSHPFASAKSSAASAGACETIHGQESRRTTEAGIWSRNRACGIATTGTARLRLAAPQDGRAAIRLPPDRTFGTAGRGAAAVQSSLYSRHGCLSGIRHSGMSAGGNTKRDRPSGAEKVQ
jgi:hypothetical protein